LEVEVGEAAGGVGVSNGSAVEGGAEIVVIGAVDIGADAGRVKVGAGAGAGIGAGIGAGEGAVLTAAVMAAAPPLPVPPILGIVGIAGTAGILGFCHSGIEGVLGTANFGLRGLRSKDLTFWTSSVMSVSILPTLPKTERISLVCPSLIPCMSVRSCSSTSCIFVPCSVNFPSISTIELFSSSNFSALSPPNHVCSLGNK
jgi:hypothetical protein